MINIPNISEENHTKLLEEIIDFKKKISEKYKVSISLVYNIPKKLRQVDLELKDFEEIANIQTTGSIISSLQSNDIRLLKYCIFKLAKEAGHSHKAIKDYFGYKQPNTVTFGIKRLNDLLATKDIKAQQLFKQIQADVKKRIDAKRLFPNSNK